MLDFRKAFPRFARYVCPDSRAAAKRVAWLMVLGSLFGGSRVLGQGSLTTSDGLRLSLDSRGAVSSLQLNSVEYATSSIPSGLFYRELPASTPNIAPNGSFEVGTTGPTSWSWTNNSAGSWSWDATNAAVGTHSMKATVPGTTPMRGPTLASNPFSVLPNTSYTVSCQTKTSGLSYPLLLYIYEQASDGSLAAKQLVSPSGTSGWTTKSLTFTTRPTTVKAYFNAYIFNGYGTAWLDNVQITDVFGGRVPVAFGGSVLSDSGGMTQTVTASGLNLSARYTSVGTAIRVDATLTDTTGLDRAIEVSFQLPVDAGGWSWDNSFVKSTVIQGGVRYENTNYAFATQGRSLYPFATVRNSVAALALAVPMIPQMQRFTYDTVAGLRSAWDMGLSSAATKTKSKATWTFFIYTESPKWGLRAAAEKFYTLDAGSFTGSVNLQGAWALANSTPLSSVSGFQDFGWDLEEGDSSTSIKFDNQNGILDYHYVDPVTWFRQFPGYTAQPPYATLVSALASDSTSGPGSAVDGIPTTTMAQAVMNSSPYDINGFYQLSNPIFWYSGDLQGYPASPDPDIPAPSMYSVIKQYSVDNRVALWQNAGNHLDGIFLDNLTRVYSQVENYRRAHWAYTTYPLTFSYTSRQPMLHVGASVQEFCKTLKAYLDGQGKGLMGSANAADLIWVGPGLDIIGGEVNGVEGEDYAYLRRALAFGKSWTNLYVPSGGAVPSAAQVLAYFRQALLLGFYPGFNGIYWDNSPAYTRDRALFKQYFPLFKKIIGAGWKPVPYATPSDAAVRVERFDDQASNVFYLTAQNSDASLTKTFQVTVDGASLQLSSSPIGVQELVGGTAMSVSRSGSNVLFTDTLAAGETALYQVTDTGSVTGPPSAIPSNGGFESGTTGPTGWTLGTSATNGSWSWDTTSFTEGSHSVKLTAPGTSDLRTPSLTSVSFPLTAGKAYTLSAWTKSSQVGGTYPPTLWLVELDSTGAVLNNAAGTVIQHSIKASLGTGSWVNKSLTFTTDSRCAKGYISAHMYKGYGVLWVDDVEVK